jgi:hypothetical protein
MMSIPFAAAVAALQLAAAQPAHPALQQDTTGAYLDARAAELVTMARQARVTQQASITAYRANTRERASALLRTPGRDRLLWRREMAADLDWRRDGPSTVTLHGAREYMAVPGFGVRVLPDAAHEALDIAFEPRDFTDYVGLGSFQFGAHPLLPGSEADYQFRAGETTALTLHDGRTIILHELVVMPRRAAQELVSGSIWLEDGTGRLVQEAYRKAAPLAGGSTPVIGRISVEASAILIEHALWEMRWWLPRVIAIDGFVRAGTVALVPFRYERTYAGYELEGLPAPVTPPADTLHADTLRADTLPADTLPPDTLPADTLRADTLRADTLPPPPQRWRVVLPADRAALLTSEHLPPSIFDEEAGPIPADLMEPLRARLDGIRAPRLAADGAAAFLHLAPFDGIRFNRVEGFSFNVRAGVDLGGIAPYADARIATAGRVLRGQLGVQAATGAGVLAVQAYDRVHAADPASRPFDAGNSIATFLFGDDYGHYYAAQGLELVRSARPEDRVSWTLRLFAEEQDSVAYRQPFTIARLFGGGTWRRAGLPVTPATQYGASIELAVGGGVGPGQLHWRVVPALGGSFGDFGFGRASLTASVATPLPVPVPLPFGGGLSAALEVAGGASAGTVPGQSLWHLGGARTVRGYPAASAAGEHFWRARAELGTTLPALRVAVFTDAGRAYGAGGFEGQPLLAAAGIGLGMAEGLVRIDLARAVRFRPGWRLQVSVDNVL